MIDKDVFANEMGLLAGTYRYEADTPVLQAYYAALSAHLSTDEFRVAVRAVVATERFWPSPAVILEKAGRDAETVAQAAFSHMHATLNNHGGYRFLPHEKFQEFDAGTKAGIKAIGGLRELTECTEQRWPGLVKRFVKAYQEALNPRPAITSGGKPDPRVASLVTHTSRKLALVSGRDRAIKEPNDD